MPIIDHVWGVLFPDIDITLELASLNTSVWLALGQYDYQTGLPFLWDEVRHQFNNLTIEIFAESAHTPQLEQAEAFNQVLLNWLKRDTARLNINSTMARRPV